MCPFDWWCIDLVKASKPSVSVVIPAFNSQATIGRAIDSCLSQADVNLEVIVVDDCSSDDTALLVADYVHRYPGVVRLHSNSRNLNSHESRRIGFGLSCAEHILFLDADDEFEPGFVRGSLDEFDKTGADIVVSSIKPAYSKGSTPDLAYVQANRQFFGVVDGDYQGESIVHSIFRDGLIVWSMMGKLFSRDLVERVYSELCHDEMFQAEDAYFVFVASCVSAKMVARESLPAYIYHMGSGGTQAGRLLGIGAFDRICKNGLVADRVESFLRDKDLLSEYSDDFRHLKRALVCDPANRYIHYLEPDASREALNRFLDHWQACDVIGSLASMGWNDRPRAFRRLLEGLPDCPWNGLPRVVGIAYHSLGSGGIERVIRHLCKVLRKKGISVVLLLDEDAPVVDVPEGVVVELLPDCFASYGDAYFDRAAVLQDAIVRNRIDCIIHNQWLGLTAPWDAALARCLGTRCVMHAHGVFFSALGYLMPELIELPLCYGVFDKVVCLSDADAAFWHNFVESVEVVVNPTDDLFLGDVDLGRPPSGRIAWCGRVEPDKSPDDLLLAVAEIAKYVPDFRVDVFGPCDDEYRKYLLSRCGELGIEQHVSFCGAVTAERLSEEYEECDLYLHTSHMEGWCLSLAEAKSKGLPAVMYDMPYLPLCQPGTGVLTAPVGDATALGRQAARLLGDHDLRRSLALEAKSQSDRFRSFDYSGFWQSVLSCDGPASVPAIGAVGGYDAERICWTSYLDAQRHALEQCEEKIRSLNAANALLCRERDEAWGQINSKAGFVLRLIRKIQRIIGKC